MWLLIYCLTKIIAKASLLIWTAELKIDLLSAKHNEVFFKSYNTIAYYFE